MLEKFTPNQRLLVAVALSFVFFIGYTTLFPPQAPNAEENTTTVSATNEVATQPTAAVTQTESNASVVSDIKTVTTDTLTTVSAKEFTLKIDTLGRGIFGHFK